MRLRLTVCCSAAVLLAACGSQWNLPFSNANPTLPSSININAPEKKDRADADKGAPQPGAPRNQGTRVWLVPVPAGDLLRLAKEPALWEKARARVDVLSFYVLSAYDHPGFECGLPCGPNTYPALRDAVPGGMFKWVYDQGIQISIDVAAVKDFACTPEKMRDMAAQATVAIRNVEATGARVSFLDLDEPFSSGTNPVNTPGFGGCALTVADTAQLLKLYIDEVHRQSPQVQVGLIEPYPHMSADMIMNAVLELERLGIRLPFLHIDMQLQQAVGERSDTVKDLKRIREFCRARSIPFGVIIFGSDGRTNEGYSRDAWATMRTIVGAVGVTDETIFQSWAESEPGNLNCRKFIPETVPDSNPVTHTGQLLRMLEYMGVQPAK